MHLQVPFEAGTRVCIVSGWGAAVKEKGQREPPKREGDLRLGQEHDGRQATKEKGEQGQNKALAALNAGGQQQPVGRWEQQGHMTTAAGRKVILAAHVCIETRGFRCECRQPESSLLK